MKETIEMSEGNKSPDKLPRRGFLKAAVIGGLGLGGAVYSGWKVLEGLGLRISQDSLSQELQQLAESPTPTPFQPRESTPTLSAGEVQTTPEPSPTPEFVHDWLFAGADFSDSAHQIDMMITLTDSSQLLVPAFTPLSWRDGLLEAGEFAPERNTGLTYLDEDRRKILNLHSGRLGPLHTGFTMWDVQLAIETNPETGNRINPREAEEKLRSQFVGSEWAIEQTSTSHARCVAAVRVPPSLVYESTRHVYEQTDSSGIVTSEGIIPWLAENFPDTGFSEIVDDPHVLVIKFCGRILSGEHEETRIASPYQQARFFLALKEA